MSQPYNYSLSIALRRLRFAVVVSCWVIALSLAVQVVVWSLATFTEMRYGDPEPPGETELIVKRQQKPARAASTNDPRWGAGDDEEPAPALSVQDRLFGITVEVTRGLGLMAAAVICPLVALGVVVSIPAGAPNVDRAVSSLVWSLVLVMLAMPLGGWFGLPWHQGALASYEHMTAAVEEARGSGFAPVFYGQFLVLPAVSAVGFIVVGFRFTAAIEAVLLKAGLEELDPELEAEASNVAASSLHGTGRSAGALKRALGDTRSGKAAKAAKAAAKRGNLKQISPGERPKRLI